MKTSKQLYLLLLISIFSVNSYAFNTKIVYKCLNKQKISVNSSLSTDGERFSSAELYISEIKPKTHLRQANCESLHDKWKNYGTETCFANEDYLFSQFKNLGSLYFFKAERKHYTLCVIEDFIQ